MEHTSTFSFLYNAKNVQLSDEFSLTEHELDEILNDQLCAPNPDTVDRIMDYAKSTGCTKVDTQYLDISFN